MSAQKKFKDNYPLEKEAAKKKSSNLEDKRMVEAYIKKISKMLEEPTNQKKAAEIISQLINQKK